MKSYSTLLLVILTGIASTFLVSCEPTPKEVADQKEQEVIAEHNVAMELMEEKCRKTLNMLKSERDEFMLDSGSHHHAHLEECNKAIGDLLAAEEAMMNWMREYSEANKTDRTDEERIKFYDEEMVKIKAVNEQLTRSIKEGEHFFHNWLLDKADKDKEKEMKEKEAAHHQWETEHEMLPDNPDNNDDDDRDVQV